MKKFNAGELKVAVLQTNTVWHDIEKNLSRLGDIMNQIVQPVDLILLPEMFATGFTLKPETLNAEEHQLLLNWLKQVAAKYNCAVSGSHPFLEAGSYYNRLFFCLPDGQLESYDKRHLFPMEGENLVYRQGKERKIIFFRSWKIFPLICYDLRFPVWSRNRERYDLLIYVSNWPAARNQNWEVLLKARAIENQCYVIGVNRTGTDGNKIRYIGNSQVISPVGELLAKLDAEEGVMDITLDRKMLIKYRKHFPVLDDSDDFEIRT
jgi:predicted amidohydrolase